MLASVHIVDSNPLRNLARRTPSVDDVEGLRWARKALCGQFSPGAMPDAQLGRGGFVAWWDDDAALDRYESSSEHLEHFGGGWCVRLRPTRTRECGFFGFEPYSMRGALAGKNATPAGFCA